jgi:hypothetical protein
MFSHIMVSTNDLDRGQIVLRRCWGRSGSRKAGWIATGCSTARRPGVSPCVPVDGEPATTPTAPPSFACASPEQADAFHAAGVAHGGVSIEEPPGVRDGGFKLYLAYLRDPDGNKLCGLHRMG